MARSLRNLVITVVASGVVAVFIAPASGQVLPRRAAKAEAQTPPAGAQVSPAQPGVAAPATPGEIRREVRQEGREARSEARDAANPRPEARDAARGTAAEARREGRQDARETRDDLRDAGAPRAEARQEGRENRQDTRQAIQASRAADFGVWLNARGNQGLIIDDISQNGVFATAGFRAGDQIVSINGHRLANETQFVQYLTAPDISGPVQIIILRDGREQTLVIQPTALQQAVVNYDPFYQYGFVVDDSNPSRLVIMRVYPRTPAYYAGFRQGDIITTLGGQRITSVDMLTQQLTRANSALNIGVTRNGQMRDIQLDVAGANTSAEARTALRPNFDGAAGANPRGAADTQADAVGESRGRNADQPRGAQPRSENNSPIPAPPATDLRPAQPRAGAGAPANPTTPALEGARGAANPGATVPSLPANPRADGSAGAGVATGANPLGAPPAGVRAGAGATTPAPNAPAPTAPAPGVGAGAGVNTPR